MLLNLLLLVGSVAAADAPADEGRIEGAVVRAVDRSPIGGAEVVLRAKVGGEMTLVAETTADAQGRFLFDKLPADGSRVYLPGANRDGIHYPGPNVRLTGLRPRADVTLTVHDSIAFPNPLVVRRHEIVLTPREGALEVMESMLVDNPGPACYVGQAPAKNAEPVTLQLAIPAEFEQVTFAEEFFGRRFAMIGGKLSTSVPWPPGRRELKFAYLLPNAQRHYVWHRPLDLPTDGLRVSVGGDQADEAACNLKRASRQGYGVTAFESGEGTLPAGYAVDVELGRMPISPMSYAPWLALIALVGLIVGTSLPMLRRRKMDRKKSKQFNRPRE